MEEFFMNWNQLQYVITIAEGKKYHPKRRRSFIFPSLPFP